MNKKIWESFKVIIDEYIAREKLLTDLLKEKDEKIKELQKDLDRMYE